jgi:hypothetical protein
MLQNLLTTNIMNRNYNGQAAVNIVHAANEKWKEKQKVAVNHQMI